MGYQHVLPFGVHTDFSHLVLKSPEFNLKSGFFFSCPRDPEGSPTSNDTFRMRSQTLKERNACLRSLM
jgi:hypothetical protein